MSYLKFPCLYRSVVFYLGIQQQQQKISLLSNKKKNHLFDGVRIILFKSVVYFSVSHLGFKLGSVGSRSQIPDMKHHQSMMTGNPEGS